MPNTVFYHGLRKALSGDKATNYYLPEGKLRVIGIIVSAIVVIVVALFLK